MVLEQIANLSSLTGRVGSSPTTSAKFKLRKYMSKSFEELNKASPKARVDWGHELCHPETCSCWNYMVYALCNIDLPHISYRKGENIYNTDSSEDAYKFCKALN